MSKEGSKFKRLYRESFQIEGNFKATNDEVMHNLSSRGRRDLYRGKLVAEKLF
jgi:uncharacterized lipoprotein YajG